MLIGRVLFTFYSVAFFSFLVFDGLCLIISSGDYAFLLSKDLVIFSSQFFFIFYWFISLELLHLAESEIPWDILLGILLKFLNLGTKLQHDFLWSIGLFQKIFPDALSLHFYLVVLLRWEATHACSSCHPCPVVIQDYHWNVWVHLSKEWTRIINNVCRIKCDHELYLVIISSAKMTFGIIPETNAGKQDTPLGMFRCRPHLVSVT